MSKRLAEEMSAVCTDRTGIPTIVLRPVMILDDAGLEAISPDAAEIGAFVHVVDVADAVVRSLRTEIGGHYRLTLCGRRPFDTSQSTKLLGWRPTRTWPQEAHRPRSATIGVSET